MGEIAEMMLDGTLDCETGEYLGDGPGYPRTADSFAKDPYLYAYDDGGKKSRNSRKPKGAWGKPPNDCFPKSTWFITLGRSVLRKTKCLKYGHSWIEKLSNNALMVRLTSSQNQAKDLV